MLFSRSSLLASLAVCTLVHANQSVTTADVASITSLKKGTFGTTMGSTCACNILSFLFRDNVLHPGSAEYNTQATAYFDLREDLSPKCVFVPTSENDLAKGVVTLDICQSQFAIRGGGHMPVPGAANTDGGVLIALSAFTNITIAADHKSVQAGPALNWYDLYSALEPYGLIAIGGRLKTIGIAGLSIGGGISYFSAKYGFAMDNIIAYDVVLASGQVVTATATSHSDLFWALKGGGSNFGIVTKFTFATYEAPLVSTMISYFGEPTVPEFIQAVYDLAIYQDQVDTGAGGVFYVGYAAATGMQPLTLAAQIGNETKPAVFENFTAIPSEFSSYNVMTLAQWTGSLDTPFQASRNLFGAHSIVADNETMQSMYAAYKIATAEMADVPGFIAELLFQPIPKSANTIAATNGIGNTWGMDDSKAYIYWGVFTAWSNAADDEKVKTWSENFVEQLHAANVAAGTAIDFMYLNDCSDDQKPFTGLPPANLARLKAIRAKYDPTLVFKRLSTGGYKLD